MSGSENFPLPLVLVAMVMGGRIEPLSCCRGAWLTQTSGLDTEEAEVRLTAGPRSRAATSDGDLHTWRRDKNSFYVNLNTMFMLHVGDDDHGRKGQKH